MWIKTLAQILLSNKQLQQYTAKKIIELLKTLANKTKNKTDNRIVLELEELLLKLGYLDENDTK